MTIRRDHKMRRAFRCEHGHILLSAVVLTTGRCVACWPDFDWPDDAPLSVYAELSASEWAAAGLTPHLEDK